MSNHEVYRVDAMITKNPLWPGGLLIALCLTMPPAPARAAEYILQHNRSIERPAQLNILALVNQSSIGGALCYSFPVQHAGLLPNLNDSLHLEGGVVTSYGYPSGRHNNFIALTPFGGLRWDFHLTDAWTLFTTARLGWAIGFLDHYNGLTLAGTVGAIWRFDPLVSLRIESGYGGLAQVGVSFPL